jgi:hypothetical protein
MLVTSCNTESAPAQETASDVVVMESGLSLQTALLIWHGGF